MFTIEALGPYDFWLDNETTGETLPASFMSRAAAELVARLLNADERNRIQSGQEPVRVVLDMPKSTPRDAVGCTKTKPKLTLDGYKQKPQKQLVIAVRDESPAPAPKGKVKVTL